ncbi:DnaJ domain-containing protein [Pedococcus bigeumensis]|uniref:DnaJ domain-containing protein n=1 Tax=Pedococcus bigeumensis TaxID=433644 RepID=UPI002FECAA9B
MEFEQDYYALLQLSRTADTATIRVVVREWRKRTHPDRGGDAETFKAIGQAEEILCGPRRSEYDAWLRSLDSRPAPSQTAPGAPAPRPPEPGPTSGSVEFTVTHMSGASFTVGGERREFNTPEELAAALRGSDAHQTVSVTPAQWRAGFAVKVAHDGSLLHVPAQAAPQLRWARRGYRGLLGGAPGDLLLTVYVVAPVPPAQRPGVAYAPRQPHAAAPPSVTRPQRKGRSAVG